MKTRFRCLVCDTEFDEFDEEYDPDGLARAPVMARTPSGDAGMAVFEIDPVWEQIAEEAGAVAPTRQFTAFGRTQVGGFVQALFLDRSPSGEAYAFGQPPPCPLGHGSGRVGTVGIPQPPEIRTMNMPLLGHARWDGMSEAERRSAIESALAEFELVEPEIERRMDQIADRSRELRLSRAAAKPPDHGVVPRIWKDPQLARRFILVALAFGVPFGLLWPLAMSVLGFTVPDWTSLALGAAAGLAFATVMALLMRNPQALLGTRAVPLAPDEVVLREGPANHKLGREYAGGWLWLTDRRLIFRSHGMNRVQDAFEVPIANVAEAKPHALFGLLPTGLRVVSRGRDDDEFVVTDRRGWLEAISRARGSSLRGGDA